MNCEARGEKSEIMNGLRLRHMAGRKRELCGRGGKAQRPGDQPRSYRWKRRLKTMPPKDRRATPRFKAKPENHITYGERSAPIRDLSLEGVFVLDPDPLPAGSEISFTLRAGKTDISLEGVVRHSVVDAGMGIQFTNLSAVSKRRLIIHIASLVSAPGQIADA
jgi:PilZ domain